MRKAVFHTKFKRDSKKIEQQGKDLSKMREAIRLLLEDRSLPERYNDHALKGRWKEYRDLHLEPDWILIYKLVDNTVVLARTGSHSEIF